MSTKERVQAKRLAQNIVKLIKEAETSATSVCDIAIADERASKGGHIIEIGISNTTTGG